MVFLRTKDLAVAKGFENNPSHVIANWMRTYRAIEYLGLWEMLYNPDFNSLEYERVKTEAPENGFVMTPKRWAETTGAVGIIPSMGKYAEIYAHKDIAFKFASWLSVEFELYIVKEFQRLKAEENKHLEWSAKRELSKLNYHIHTDAIKENLILPKLTPIQKSYVYADEADLLNVALFGETAREWREKHPDEKGNMRDYATLHQLLVLANMESHNAAFITEGLLQVERLERLRGIAERELRVLLQQATNSPLLLGKTDKKK
ncbi:MAG: KilA-N domain-containing protein [Clostridiales bacterium]|jgi:hypothetical protein|nr:KilA-N domain-containing protein [Clostridiales bacterium]